MRLGLDPYFFIDWQNCLGDGENLEPTMRQLQIFPSFLLRGKIVAGKDILCMTKYDLTYLNTKMDGTNYFTGITIFVVVLKI